MSNGFFTSAIILAAGVGSRMRSNMTKQKMKIASKSVLYRAVSAFESAETIDEIIVVCRKEEIEFAKAELVGFSKIKAVVVGGKSRRGSAECGFSAISDEAEFVAVHDAARCLVSPSLIDRVATAAYLHLAASAVSPVTDTVKRVDREGMIVDTVSRDMLRFAQTPQIFERTLYAEALSASEKADVTDDNMMVELAGAPIFAVENEEYNFKITTKKDIEYAEFLLQKGYINE